MKVAMVTRHWNIGVVCFEYMTIKVVEYKLKKKLLSKDVEADLAAWGAVAGIWRHKKGEDPVKYQRRIREESDKRRGL